MKASEAIKALQDGKIVVHTMNGLRKCHRIVYLTKEVCGVASWWDDEKYEVVVKKSMEIYFDGEYSIEEDL